MIKLIESKFYLCHRWEPDILGYPKHYITWSLLRIYPARPRVHSLSLK